MRYRPFEERFWEKVLKSPFPGCWTWTGGGIKGYGHIRTERSQGMILAHRASWELHNGPVPAGLLVLHKCDNPGCVNPTHLFLGTDGDNSDDKWAKNRGVAPSGELNGYSKLTCDDVREIRLTVLTRGTVKALAKQFNVHRSAIWKVRTREVWTHIE
jgi:hypothetical protein